MSYLLERLTQKVEIDQVIMNTIDKVLVLRFGRESDMVCMQLDDILAKAQREASKMAEIYIVDVDAIPTYIQYFDVTLIPSTVFFFNAHHMKVDYGTQDHTKFIGAFHTKQDFLDLIEVIYRGALKGKYIVDCPIPPSRIPQYQLIYRDI
eukprot:TRINITY_DN2474_c0_g1_i1.p1 TRINITY_DN2474_c0_g1~~TRINITY_DN2474_c0_g1_i1.p1  ORF type:complete len:150 (+),score=24.15 TRINITY_DN2474_c0_g1_i1:47-496(+)